MRTNLAHATRRAALIASLVRLFADAEVEEEEEEEDGCIMRRQKKKEKKKKKRLRLSQNGYVASNADTMRFR